MERKLFLVPAFASALVLGACGLTVPQIRDFPNNATEAQNVALVQAIIRSIHCELKDAVTSVVDNYSTNLDVRDFYKRWGAQVALTLQFDEKSTVNPSALWMPPSPATAVFTLGGGISGTADATRVDKINYQYTVRDLYLRKGTTCERNTRPGVPTDSLLIQSDLKLAEWLETLFGGVATGQITGLAKQNVISHQITFQITTSGNATPSWKLVRATINPSGSFFSTSRDRKHDLLITFGILDAKSGTFLQPIAESTHISSQLSSSLTGVLRNNVNQ